MAEMGKSMFGRTEKSIYNSISVSPSYKVYTLTYTKSHLTVTDKDGQRKAGKRFKTVFQQEFYY